MYNSIEQQDKKHVMAIITPMEASRKGRMFYGADRSRAHGVSLNIERILERSRERSIVEARKRRIERLGLTEWKIWKLLRIEWE
jgi:hypothetical protein